MDLGIAGFYVSVSGVIISLTIFLLTTKYKRPVFFIEFDNIIRENTLNTLSLKKLKLLYENTEIQSLSKSVIFIWNKGRKTIRRSDLLIDKPFGIRIENADILEINYVTTEAMSKSFDLDMNDKEKTIKLTFDSMQKNEGVMLEILHTGSNKECIKIIGDIDDAAKLEDNKKAVRRKALIALVAFVVWLSTLTMVAILNILGKFEGGLFGYGFGHGKGSGITYLTSQIGIIGLMAILFPPGILFFKFCEKTLNFLPDTIMSLKDVPKTNFFEL